MTERAFHTPEPVELEVKVPSGDVEVETVDGEESTVVVEGSDALVERTRVELVGNRLVVELQSKGPFGIAVSFGDFGWGSRLRIRARVPHSSVVRLSTASADMELRGRYASLTSRSASGDIAVEGEIAGDADIRTVSGDARLPSVRGSLVVQTVSGDVVATSVGGDVTAKSVSGDVRVGSARAGRITAQSVSGDIEIGVEPGTSLDVDAGSLSGDLSSEVALGSEILAPGDGPVLVVRGKTVSGDFKVFRAA